jgi:hypothetical protein
MEAQIRFGHLYFEFVSDFDPPASPCSHGGQVFEFRIYGFGKNF